MKIFLDAYLDNNIGDDLMIQGIANFFPNYEFYIRNENSVVRNTFKNETNIIFLDAAEAEKFIETVKIYITIGGSVFQYRRIGDMISKVRKIRLLKKLKRRGVKIFTLGANLGPFNQKFSHKLAKTEINLNNFISVRDEASFRYLVENAKGVSIHRLDDIVLGMDNLRNLSTEKEPSNIIGISAYRSVTKSNLNNNVYDSIASTITKMFTVDVDKIRLFAFDTENENDLSACHHILNRVDSKYHNQIEIVPYLGDINNFLEKFSSCNTHISIRFHSAILSHLFEIPFIPVAYSNKMSDYISDHQGEYEVPLIEELNNQSEDLLFNYYKKNKYVNQKYVRKQNHFETLDKFWQR